MGGNAISYHAMPDGTRIAYRHCAGDGPLLVFLPGYMSDMDGGKATAVFEWAQDAGHACLLLDYSGCGKSDGDFADGSLTRWRDEVLALVEHVAPGEPVILIGSSMGGWLMLLVALALAPERRAGLIGIAAAPDFTDWGFDATQKVQLDSGETVYEDNPYGPEPTPTHAQFWADGENNRLLDAAIALACPVRLIHGQRDADVPWELSLRLAERLPSEDLRCVLITDGDHRLSREQDIAAILREVAALVAKD